jgi:hypothetical protein
VSTEPELPYQDCAAMVVGSALPAATGNDLPADAAAVLRRAVGGPATSG